MAIPKPAFPAGSGEVRRARGGDRTRSWVITIRTDPSKILFGSPIEQFLRAYVYPMDTKICVKCKQEKSVLDFHKNARSSDGLHSYCKECNKAQALAHIRAEKARKALLRAAKKVATPSKG